MKTIPHQHLLEQVARILSATGTETDDLLLTRWRVLSLCQRLLSSPNDCATEAVINALQLFCDKGPCEATGQALCSAAATSAGSIDPTILPGIGPEKRAEVLTQLRQYEDLGGRLIGTALEKLPRLRKRLRKSPAGALLAGMRHRLELVAAIVEDEERKEDARCRAATALLYLDEIDDAIPDTLELIGLLDDDFALRAVLEELGHEDDALHWAERISSLWDDLPFLRGVRLRGRDGPVATTWLDRINSYVSYVHSLDSEKQPLVLVQPSVACSPLHSVVSLIGLLVFDGITSSKDLIGTLKKDQIYAIDGKFYARFDGESDRRPGWLRLRFRDCVVERPPSIADRMVAARERRLSACRAFSKHVHSDDAEPIQRFFNWDEAIGAASIPSRVILVTSRDRAAQLFSGVGSNGIGLLDHGIVRFAGLRPSPADVRGGLVLVVPNLSIARQVTEQGVAVHAIVVDGYQRLHRGRHDLPFLLRRSPPLPIIAWSHTGYYPKEPPGWLPEHRRLQVSPDDLSYILELDGDIDDAMAPGRASLWEAATSASVCKTVIPRSAEEVALSHAIKEFLQKVRSSPELPEYWQYQLYASALSLRILATATPAFWCDIKEHAANWREGFAEQWETLRPRAAAALRSVELAHGRIYEVLGQISKDKNSKAEVVLSFPTEEAGEDWFFVCDRPEQLKVFGRLVRRTNLRHIHATRLRDLGVCRSCLVAGWLKESFARRLWAHTPSRIHALVDEKEGKRWDRVQREMQSAEGDSLLEAVGHKPLTRTPKPARRPRPPSGVVVSERKEELLPCVFLWLADEPEGKVLAPDSRVLTEDGEQARERLACDVGPEDRVILGSGASRWSPADEFTQAVVNAVEASHPELARDVKEWRRALAAVQKDRGWDLDELKRRLNEVGICRENQTLEGWLSLERAAPIGPQKARAELQALWALFDGKYTERTAEDVARACTKLRSLRTAAGRSLLKLWKGRSVDIGVDEEWLEDLVARLRQEVQVHEVDATTYGAVPEPMIGWWVSPEVASSFEEGGGQQLEDFRALELELSEEEISD